MRVKYLYHLFLVLFFSSSQVATAQIYINEFVASNDTGIVDESGAFEDWVELYNAGSSPVDIANYYLSDDLAEPTLWQIPATSPTETTISAGGFLILWFDKDTEEGVLHVDAKLSGGGESIVLTAPDGLTIEDSHTYGPQLADVSEGRVTDGADDFTFFTTPTPGATNAEGTGLSPLPIFSIPGGLYLNSQTISISTANPADIYYTTDGSTPDENSNLYTSPLTLSTPTPIRAIAVGTDLEPSSIVTETYLIGVSHAYPIVALTGNPSDFFDEETGVFGNYEEDIEININAELYEVDGTLGFNQVVESEIVGVSSAMNDQKSLALKAKGSLGSSKFDYPVFPDEELTEYRSLMLRNSGNDWNVTQFRDASVSSLIRDLSDVGDLIAPSKVNYQAYRPSIMYLNGEYWGIYNLRERSDKRYIKHRFDLDDDEIDFIENEDEVKEGDILNWDSLQVFLEENTFDNEANYAALAEWVDVEEFMDLAVYNIFIDNQDWPGNNNRRFRERVEDGKWHFLSYDIDFVFGLFTSEGWNTGYAGDNALDRLLNPSDFSHPNPEWSARLFYKLIENENWRNDFINRSADHLNTLFLPTRISNRLDEFQTTFDLEFEQQQEMWQNLYNQEENVNLMKSFGNERTEIVQGHYVSAFSEVDNTAEISISTQPAGAGYIEFSTLNIDEEDDTEAWTGTYFTGIDIPVKAVAKPGFVFQYWEGVSSDTSPEILVNLSANGLLTAVFMEEDVEPLAQTIDFEEISDQVNTTTSITLNATASSGLPVSFSLIEGPATLSGSTLTLNGQTGLVAVEASQAGNVLYEAATSVVREFNVFEPLYEISFSVDMNNYEESYTTVYLSGSFNDWSTTINPMSDPDNDGIWTTTLELGLGIQEYKFSLDEGVVFESLSIGEICANDAGNREIEVIEDAEISTVCWATCEACIAAPELRTINFSVDMNNYAESYTTVYLSGSFNDWSTTANPMSDPDNDGIWTTTLELEIGTQEYKFSLDEGVVFESLSTGEICVNDAGNREIEVIEDAEVFTVCWETCEACIAAPELRTINFSVDMNNYAESYTTVYLSGSFNDWSTTANPMSDPDNDGVWTTTLELELGTQEYKFSLDEGVVFESLSTGEICVNDAGNREIEVIEDAEISTVCWETCEACIAAPELRTINFSVDMNNYAESYTTVYLSGSFNDWSTTANPMSDPDNDGIWTITTELEIGTQEYKFLLDEGVVFESLSTGEICVNDAGNREIEVIEDAEISTVCWETCEACIAAPELRTINFSVDMNNYAESYTTVYLSGSFNDWSTTANPMSDSDNDGIWTTTLELELGTQKYKFLLDETIFESLSTTESCINEAGNREIVITEDIDVPNVCWETCMACLVALENIEDSDFIFTLQPTPAQNYTSIILKQNYQSGTQVYISDALGRQVYTIIIEANTLQHSVNTSNWAAGTYFVRLSSDDKMGVRRLLITK